MLSSNKTSALSHCMPLAQPPITALQPTRPSSIALQIISVKTVKAPSQSPILPNALSAALLLISSEIKVLGSIEPHSSNATTQRIRFSHAEIVALQLMRSATYARAISSSRDKACDQLAPFSQELRVAL
eukprot:gnl/MRDRNA2_/MRDRNA2_230586_c0_seq1.p1 gnl/MRDRNA2_/MRDRNA2_230586_c0~~gnl/MRDRNA2_/MRDRNA2_230586_c0_seq1.p1  ORF type:complete len:145 (-),score=1.12 gnl/MRDRNA2_/MRDRNA2_230586_c0_seq1:294-680(-)